MNTEMNKQQIVAKLEECQRAEGFVLHIIVEGEKNVELDKFLSFSAMNSLDAVQKAAINEALTLAGAASMMAGKAQPVITPPIGEPGAPSDATETPSENKGEIQGAETGEANIAPSMETQNAELKESEASTQETNAPEASESPDSAKESETPGEPNGEASSSENKQEDEPLTYEEALEVKLTFKEGFKPTKVLSNLKGLTMRELLSERPQMLGVLANPESSMVKNGDINRKVHLAAIAIRSRKE